MSMKDKNCRTIIMIEALLIAVTFHVSLLFLFSVPATGNVAAKERHRRISVLPLGGGDPVSASISNWIDYADPTLTSKPDERYGYSVAAALPSMRQSPGVVIPGHVLRMPDFSPGPAVSGSGREVFSVNGGSALYGGVVSSSGVVRETVGGGPVAIASDGTVVAEILYGSGIRVSLSGGGMPDSSTLIHFEAQDGGLMPRYRIVRSCGVEALDREALRACLGSERLQRMLKGRNMLSVSVYWGDGEALKSGTGEKK